MSDTMKAFHWANIVLFFVGFVGAFTTNEDTSFVIVNTMIAWYILAAIANPRMRIPVLGWIKISLEALLALPFLGWVGVGMALVLIFAMGYIVLFILPFAVTGFSIYDLYQDNKGLI